MMFTYKEAVAELLGTYAENEITDEMIEESMYLGDGEHI